MEPQTRAHQVLPQIAILVSVDLGTRILEKVVLDERTELRGPIAICGCEHLPREVCVTSPPVNANFDVGGFDVVDLISVVS